MLREPGFLDGLEEKAPYLFGEKPAEVIHIGRPPAQQGVAEQISFKKETFNLTKQGLIMRRDPARARRLAAEAGVELKAKKGPSQGSKRHSYFT